MPEVKCSVSNCSFWGQGNFCQASEIIVQPDAEEAGQTENASYTGVVLTNETIESSVTTSVETCCHTFQPKY
ncbi:disulfide formation protein C [Bacillus cereus]|nr:disulfide formation protein C [Bacillus cereus]PGU67030.1 disulfide formation protein C [Bacillus cereus]